MPRQARLDAPGTLHHVMIRGIEKREIVNDLKDKRDFIEYMGSTAVENDIKIYAWSLMDNHAHILLKSGKPGLSKYMRRFLTRYAMYYNKRYQRHGYLFQNRYKSIVCEEDAYFQELVRYIHLNPVRAQIIKRVADLDQYPFCGHGGLMGYRKLVWQDRDYVLRWFGKTEFESVKAYRQYIKDGFSQGERPELTGGSLVRSAGRWSSELSQITEGRKEKTDQRILGSSEFIKQVLKEAEDKIKYHVPLNKTLEKIPIVIEAICRSKGFQVRELKSGSRRHGLPGLRKEIAVRLIKKHGITLAEAARQLGLTMSAVSKMMRNEK